MQSAAILTAFIALVLCLIGHKYQLTTLAVAKLYTKGEGSRKEIARLQMAMNPLWLGYLKVFDIAFGAVAVVLLYLEFSWWGPAVFLFLNQIGVGVTAPSLPLMPYTWNLMQIENFLRRCHTAVVMGEPVPEDAWIGSEESFKLQRLADRLSHDYSRGSVSISRISLGRFTQYSTYV